MMLMMMMIDDDDNMNDAMGELALAVDDVDASSRRRVWAGVGGGPRVGGAVPRQAVRLMASWW